MTTTTKQLDRGIDHLRDALNSYAAAVGSRMDSEVEWVRTACDNLRARLAQMARGVVAEADGVVANHGPDKVRQSLASQARRAARARERYS